MQNGFSLDKLKKQRFEMYRNTYSFLLPSDEESSDSNNDIETMPKPTLLIKNKDGEVVIEQTEYTKEFLSID